MSVHMLEKGIVEVTHTLDIAESRCYFFVWMR
jgi:hypothetical protein